MLVGAMVPGLELAATYRRRIHASPERVWENVRDWEHLPWLHRSAFYAIECLDSGEWGWRARVGLQPAARGRESRIELLIEPGRDRYVTRTLDGPGRGTEIWTYVEPGPDVGAAGRGVTDIRVDFHLAQVPPAQLARLGQAYTGLYARLWDEDEGMMQRRAELLGSPGLGRRATGESLDLGPLAELRERLPVRVRLAGVSYRVLDLDGELIAHATTCPHALGPLEDASVKEGCIRCPWHGYEFDLRSGLSSDGRRLRLPVAPRVRVDPDSGLVTLQS